MSYATLTKLSVWSTIGAILDIVVTGVIHVATVMTVHVIAHVARVDSRLSIVNTMRERTRATDGGQREKTRQQRDKEYLSTSGGCCARNNCAVTATVWK
jgi:hypothetical protein